MRKIVVFLTALAFVAGMALPAFAADWNFYGSARIKSFYEWTDDDDDKFDSLDFGLQGNSRIGARVKTSDAVSGQFEFAVTESTVNTRILLGHWNFGPGTFTVGQGYTPVDLFYSTRAWGSDEGLLSNGEPYTGRRPMLQVAVSGFKFALVKVHGTEVAGLSGGPGRLAKITKFELSYGQSFGLVSFDVVGGYQWYEYDNGVKEYDVDAYMIGAGVWVKPGPARIGVIGYWARNSRQFGQYYGYQPASFGRAVYDAASDEVKDNDAWALAGIVGFKATDMLNFEVGYGYTESELDIANPATEKWQTFYVQAAVTLAPGVSIVPEYGFIEDRGDGADYKLHYFGAKWQINF